MWRPRQLPDDFVQTTEVMFQPMAESAKPAFSEADLRCLQSLIRLTAEFHLYLRTLDVAVPDKNDLVFACESIFSGLDSFVTVSQIYRALVGSVPSNLSWNLTSLQSLKDQFNSMYREFLSERLFERKCRLLLDMFKLQIVFTGLLFE